MKEIWKNIKGYNGNYEVSNLGNVLSYKGKLPRLLSPSKDSHGYLCLSLSKDNTQKTMKIHKLVAIAFLGHKPNGHVLVVDHINGVKTDNRLENLQIITQKENIRKGNTGRSRGLRRPYIKVNRCKKTNLWISTLYVEGKESNSLEFETELEARLSYRILMKNEKK